MDVIYMVALPLSFGHFRGISGATAHVEQEQVQGRLFKSP